MSKQKNDEPKFYTCRYDRSFKEVMLKDSNKDILTKLLEQTLNIKVKSIIEKNIELNQGNIHLRRKNLDILLKTDIGIIGIELNIDPKAYTYTRNYAFHCDNYAHYTYKGKQYKSDVLIIQINFTYGLKLKSKKDYEDIAILEKYTVQNDRGRKFIENAIIYEWNMDKIMDIWYSKDERKIDKYKYLIMLDLEQKELKNLSKEDRMVDKYMSEIEKLNEDPEFREYMTKEEDDEKIRNTELHLARDEGIKKGLKKGKKEGLKKGISQGIKQEKIEIARNLKKLNAPLEMIMESTGLTKDEIEKL